MSTITKARLKLLQKFIDESALTNNKILSDDFFERKDELQRTAYKNKLVLGVEFQISIKDNVDLVQHIIDNDLNELDSQLKQKLKRETDSEFEKRSIIKDRRDIGTLLGIVIGLVIAIAVSGLKFSIVAIILGVIFGGLIGRVFGYLLKRKLTKANQKVRNLLFGFFESYTSIISRYTENLSMDVNSTRIILEHSLDKYRLPLYLAKEEKSEFVDLLCSFEKILSTPRCYNALNLSWKLFLINCKTWIEKDEIGTIFTRYNNIYCVYREILVRVWEKRNNSKVNSVLDEIGSFAALEPIMRGFEFNLIHNIYVPTEEELEKLIDVNTYHEKMTVMMNEDTKFGNRIPNTNPNQLGELRNIANPLEIDVNEIAENIAKLPAAKNMDIPRISGMPTPSIGDGGVDESGRKGSLNLLNIKSPEDVNVVVKNDGNLPNSGRLGSVRDNEEGNSANPQTPSKSQAKEVAQPSNKQLDRLLELEAWDVSEWTEAHSSEFIQIYKRKEEDSPVILIKAYTLMKDIPPEKVFRLIYDLDIRSEWDNVLSNMKIFGKVNENVDHMYSLYRAPIGISNRDFCQRRTRSSGYKGTAHMIHFESVDHPECPPLKGTIRAHTTISGYIIRPSTKFPGSTQMTIMTQTDIKGLVPKIIVNMAAAKAPSDWCKNFKKNADRLIKAGKL